MDTREIIEKHMTDLVDSIEFRNTTLWDSLIQLELFRNQLIKGLEFENKEVSTDESDSDLH